MNLLFVNNVFPPGFIGGYELGAYEIAQGLIARGHKVNVLTSDYFQDDDFELREMDVERTLECNFVSHEILSEATARIQGFYINNNNIRKLGSALRRWKPDVVILFNLMGLGTLGILQFVQASGIPVILYLMDNVFLMVDRHSDIYAKFVSIFGRPVFGPGVKVVAMSRNLIGEISQTLGMGFDEVLYIPGWVDLADDLHEPLSGHDTAVRFVVCSRIAPHKGTELILDAAANLVRRGAVEFSIDVYGAGQVGPFLYGVQVRKLNGFIRYCGCKPKSEMLKLFGQYDALLFPTWQREPFGFTVSEAAASGCFPIMTSGIGAGEWFINDVDCIKIARTAESLASAMYRTIAMTADERIRLRRAAMKTARLNLSLDHWIKVIERTCGEMTDKRTFADTDMSRGIQAAFLFLGHMWRESLNL
jgi:glycogen synthase